MADYLITKYYLRLPGIGADGELNPLLRYMIDLTGSFDIIFLIKVIVLMASFFAMLSYVKASSIISFTLVTVLTLQVIIVIWGICVVLYATG
jgi:hypothetical protein